ncbi:MAG: tetratricopeptide repeat protein, partial [Chloroflexota bacterium]|nr:tetratricopeptide repeat protein [Chloroflexota bacterium]
MTKISLRAYNQEIENMTNERQIEEAIAHCQHILRTFPKHIGTYRLLGKAYLENSQHSNAADIFQRVLSAVPDDFVSHIGMSIIREDEGNFEAATAHMEKAYEKQPYNPAIQDELRRLYGKRDGMEPPKVQLTQGALARMYIKGNLIQQGIAEIRSALAKNPKQIDLLALLAQAYVEANKKNEALEVASTILKKFPHNITANRIMTELLSDREHPNVMKACRQRLYALSPYQTHISEHAPTEEQVPNRAITLTQLDWNADQARPQTSAGEKQPDWATSIGINIESEEEEDILPSWLSDDDAEDAEEKNTEYSGETEQEEDDLIPDWMQDAGWGASEGEVDEP